MSATNSARLIFLLISALAVSSGTLAATETPEKPPIETPDPLGQFLEHQYIKNKLSLFIETQYYEWEKKNDSSSRGMQTVTPLTLTYRYNDFDFGLRRAFITSENKTVGAQGKVSSWSDTALTVAYTFKEQKWPVRLSLDYNANNGKATLNGSEKNAIMDSFLVQQTQFGEGENITPGISITHAFGEKDVFGFGLSFSNKGAYDPNSDVSNDVIDPGDETIATLQWQHNEHNWMVIGGLIATQHGTTQRNNIDYYEKGNRYDLNITGIYALPWTKTQGQQLTANLRYITQDKDKNFNPAANALKEEANDSNPDTMYLSIDWSENWKQHHTFHIFADYLKAKENSYIKTDASYDAGKSRRGIGIGYDYAVSNRSAIAIRAKHFYVIDKSEQAGVSDTKYRGNNVALNFSYQF